jgi:DNA (cytosine-5)-methyltransferase 1
MVFETVCTDLEGEGYEVRAFNIPAAGVGAPHRRERIWIVAHAKRYNKTNEIRRGDEEERRIQEEHRQDDSSSRLTSGTSSIRQSNNRHEDMEDSRRTLQSRTELREKNEDEVGEGYANQHQRSSSPSESNVANTYTRLRDGTFEEVQSGWQTFDTSSERITDVANTESSNRNDNETVTGDGGSQTQEIFGNGSSLSGEGSWWHVEPDVGRVAHGIPGRVYRLKGLGNSIVPKIAEEIGKAIIEAEREK